MMNMTANTVQNQQMMGSAKVAMSQMAFQQAEDDFDAEFFGRKMPKIKLNKGEKRALKFALKSGVNINEVGDLRAFLAG